MMGHFLSTIKHSHPTHSVSDIQTSCISDRLLMFYLAIVLKKFKNSMNSAKLAIELG
jgi:hypothetical protein